MCFTHCFVYDTVYRMYLSSRSFFQQKIMKNLLVKLKTPFTFYFGLINAIPVSYKSVIKKSLLKFAESEKTKEIISTKNVYSILLKEIFVPPTAENKILRYGFSHETIHKVYELPFQIKNDIAITMFQYKIIHNILATKVSLCRAKICDNNVCPQCLTDTHSLDHMFLHCPSAIAFWKTFQSWYANKTKQSLNYQIV